jgi:hypothetical protein
MRGDVPDISSRLRAVLPKRWFNDHAPILSAVLASIATPWAWLYSQLAYVRSQSRILTATDNFLDLVALDYFGSRLRRNPGESDSMLRIRIVRSLIPDAACRSAIAVALRDITGFEPEIFEPSLASDTGSYGAPNNDAPSALAYGQAGGWGSLELPLQFFVTVRRPVTAGITALSGYGTGTGAFGAGLTAYVSLELIPGQISDLDIQQTITGLLPVNTTAWLKIV